jgi:hypothetical protein
MIHALGMLRKGKRKNTLACMDHAILHGKPFGIPLVLILEVNVVVLTIVIFVNDTDPSSDGHTLTKTLTNVLIEKALNSILYLESAIPSS